MAAIVDRDPLVCSIVTEAALRVALSHRSISSSSSSSQQANLAPVINTCYKAGIAVDFVAEATARAQAADQQATGTSSAVTVATQGAGSPVASSPLAKQLFYVLVAAGSFSAQRTTQQEQQMHLCRLICCACSSTGPVCSVQPAQQCIGCLAWSASVRGLGSALLCLALPCPAGLVCLQAVAGCPVGFMRQMV